ncbi:hypothetical protein [Flavobacterium koreense]
MKKLLSIFFIILFFFCSKKNENDLPRLIVPKQENVVEVNSKEMLQNRSPIIAVNFISSSKVLTNNYGRFVFDEKKLKFVHNKFDTVFSRTDLKIIIDTSYVFTSKGIAYKNLLFSVNDTILKDSIKKPFFKNKLPFGSIRNLEVKSVSSYPVLFYNNSNKGIIMGSLIDGLKIIQEAKDIDGIWKPIEFHNNINGCLGPMNLLLEPKHYTAIAIIKYKGSFKTKIRVKYLEGKNIYYSNEINGAINKAQFNQEYLLDFYRDTHSGSYPRYFEDFKKRIFLNN